MFIVRYVCMGQKPAENLKTVRIRMIGYNPEPSGNHLPDIPAQAASR